MTFEDAAIALELVHSGVTRREVARQFGVSHTHLGRVLKQCAELGKDAPLVNVDRLGRPRTVPAKDVKRAMVMRDNGLGYIGIARALGYDADVLRKAVWHYDNQTKRGEKG